MASIEERLNREDWNPMPGEQIIGIITGLEVRESKKGTLYPVLIVKDGQGEHVVPCALMAGEVIAARPRIGDRVGVKFWGPTPKSDGSGDTWDKYAIAFERDEAPAEPDWAAMAAARGMTIRTAPEPAPRSSAPADDPWASDPKADDTPAPF